MNRRVHAALALLLLAVGAARFLSGGFLPATRVITGDFGAVFPTAYFARFRPDFPADQVWASWRYGPMLHFVTLPLLMLPTWSMVPKVWAICNLLAVAVSFWCAVRLAGVRHKVSWVPIVFLAAVWLMFQPLTTAFACGNIELLEMALMLAALVSLQSSKDGRAGGLLGVATMLKFLPIGFLGWCLLRRRWRAVLAGILTITLIAIVTEMTLGWRQNNLSQPIGWVFSDPMGGMHELSVTSMFLHRTGMVDAISDEEPMMRWLPSVRATFAAGAGAVASLLLSLGIGALFLLRRRSPISREEIGVLFMTMFMVLPWNHDYYYVFALVPISLLVLRAIAVGDWTTLAITVVASLLISPPVPFSLMDRLHLVRLSFAYWLNVNDVPTFGGLVLWFMVTYRWMAEPVTGPDAEPWPAYVRRLVWVAGGVAALAFVWLLRPATIPPSSTSAVRLESASQMDANTTLALSPDGQRFAYIDQSGALCTRRVDDRTASTCWAEPHGARAPFFSPDGQWIAYFADDELRKVPSVGGSVQHLGPAIGAFSGRWAYDPALPAIGREGSIVFSTPAGIYWMKDAKELAALIVPARADDGRYLSPIILPPGDVAMFSIAPLEGSAGAGAIVTQSIKTGQRIRIINGTQPSFDVPSGRLIYADAGRVLASSYSPETMTIAEVADTLAPSVRVTRDAGAQFAISAQGSIVYVPGQPGPAAKRTLQWVDRRGTATELSVRADAFEAPRVSPDGHSIATIVRDVLSDVWTFDVRTGAGERLAVDATQLFGADWKPDGTSLTVSTEGPILWDVRSGASARPASRVWQAAKGESAQPMWPGGWSRDGRFLIGSQRDHVWLLEMNDAPIEVPKVEPARPTAPILPWARLAAFRSSVPEQQPALSPDGRWIAYVSTQPGGTNVFVRASSGVGSSFRVSDVANASEPLWSRDGRELFFRSGDRMMAAAVSGGAAFSAAPARVLFEGRFATSNGHTRNYDVAPDGEHFVMVTEPAARDLISDIVVINGWTAKLRR